MRPVIEMTEEAVVTTSLDEYADEPARRAEPYSNPDDDEFDSPPLVIVDMFQGSVTDALPSLLSICKVEGRVDCCNHPRLALLEEAAKLLEICAEKYCSTPMPNGHMTATIGRYQRRLAFPLYRIDAAADNGLLFATLYSIDDTEQSVRRIRVPMDDDDVIRLLERVLRVFATTQL